MCCDLIVHRTTYHRASDTAKAPLLQQIGHTCTYIYCCTSVFRSPIILCMKQTFSNPSSEKGRSIYIVFRENKVTAVRTQLFIQTLHLKNMCLRHCCCCYYYFIFSTTLFLCFHLLALVLTAYRKETEY